MSHSLTKILFNDKEDLININADSKYVLTASNVNEIKDIVNSLIDEYDSILTYDQIFKYIRFNVPKDLIKNQFYSLKIQLSSEPEFLNIKEIVCYPSLSLGETLYENEEDNNSIFSIFKNNIWKSYKNLILTSDDEDTEVKINIQNFIKDETSIPFFGRYKLINLSTSNESEWQGFVLGFSNYKNNEYFKADLKEVKIVGKTEIFGKSTNLYNLIGIKTNNIEVNLTPSATFSIVNESSSSFNRNVLSTLNIINEETQVLKAECEYNNVLYSVYLPIYIKPFQLIQFYIDGPFEIPEHEEREFTIKARCKNGDILDLTENCTISIESQNCRL